MSTYSRRKISWWNAAIAVAAALGAMVLMLMGRWGSGAVMVVVAIAVVGAAVYARSGRASDLHRINAAEYVDERDRVVAVRAFSIVGVAALLLSLLLFVVSAAVELGGAAVFLFGAQSVALAIVWSIANAIALRRS